MNPFVSAPTTEETSATEPAVSPEAAPVPVVAAEPPAPREWCPKCLSMNLSHQGDYVHCPFCFWQGTALDLVGEPK